MAKRSLKACSNGIIKAKKAFERKGWTQEYLATEVGLSTRQSVWKFFTGRAIERHIFMDLCFQLDLDWQEIADAPQTKALSPLEKSSLSLDKLDIDKLVTQVRSCLKPQVQSQCSKLQSSLELAQPLHLEHIYTNMHILTNLTSQRWLEVSDLQGSGSHSERISFTAVDRQTTPVQEVININSKLVILGKPGAGKTTLLQYLALQSIEGNLPSHSIPILISLRTFIIKAREINKFNLLNYISQVWGYAGISLEQIETLLQQGKVLILLDGLDEVPQEHNRELLEQIQQFSQVYYQNQIIITCRIAAQQYRFYGFTYVELADFNQTQIVTFAQKWFTATAQDSPEEGIAKANQFLEQLQRQENLPIRELLVTPILLNLICSVFQARLSFPTKRAKLYQEGLDILLIRWDRTRGIHRDCTYRNLSLPDKIKLLSQIAAINFEGGDYFFEKSEVLQIIADYLLTLPNANTDPETLSLDSQAVLRAIEVQHGLLVERARGIYSFSHLTFQEYLTARKIFSSPNPQELNQSLQKLATHTYNSQWREVLSLTASMLPNVDFLYQEMKQQVDGLLEMEPQLLQFIKFLDRKVNFLSVPYQPSAVRAFYFSLFLDRDLNLAISLDNTLASSLTNDLALDLALSRALANATTLVENADIKQILNLIFALDFERSFELTEAMDQELKILKAKLPILELGKDSLIAWWQTYGLTWIQDFRSLISQHRYQGQDWEFNYQQKQLLRQYYQAHQFLLECFERNSKLKIEPNYLKLVSLSVIN